MAVGEQLLEIFIGGSENPALYDPAARADLAPDTEEGLRALGYVE